MMTGRTARIGNEGLATSFYNDRDSAMAPFITKILVETNQTIPDFLEQYKPEGPLNFDEEDPDIEDGVADGETGDDWGAGGGTNAAAGSNDAWGAGNAAAAVPEPESEPAWGANTSTSTGAW